MIITIDGPAGTGKTTVAKRVAERLKFPHFDTGAMYRAVALLLLQRKISYSDENQISEILKNFSFKIRGDRYFVNGQDVTQEIRSQAVTTIVSPVSALPAVRDALKKIQRDFARRGNSVFEGRDLGTAVFPEAEIKIFLTARPEVRAQRRLDEMLHKRPHEVQGMDRTHMLEELLRRDTYDSSRAVAPLKCPPDAYVIDTSDISIHSVVDRILEYKQKKNLKPAWMHFRGVKFLYRITLFSAWLFVKIFYRHRVYGLEHFYPRGAIIAANHTSFLDPPLVSISWPEEVHFLARDTLFKGWFGKLIRAVNAHPVSGEASDIGVFRTISQLLNEGKKIIIFPEGKRSFDGELGPIKPGIGMLISRTQSAIVPAYVSGAYKVWSRHRKLPKLWGKTVCVFGTPIQWHEFAHLEKKEAQEAIAKKLAESLLGLKKWLENGAKGIPP